MKTVDTRLKLNEYADYVRHWRMQKEFKTPTSLDTVEDRDLMLGKLMLVVTEVAEAAEAVRHADIANFHEELSDTFIRLMDICATVGLNIEVGIEDKMSVNEQRPLKHGKLCSL